MEGICDRSFEIQKEAKAVAVCEPLDICEVEDDQHPSDSTR